MPRLVSRCPICNGSLRTTEVACDACAITVRGRLDPCRFCRLTPAQSELVEMFLRSRGNLTSLCDQVGLSYPTVVKRLETAINALDAAPAQPDPTPVPDPRIDETRSRVLGMLDRGEITAEEATRRLQDL